ncbi:MAG: hypothetical protein FRX49_08443 [Trebouxia sp. A1-2]|nr:MAG: hypothetical protein FRX49_08443 [Trebouxia sp. A1-2]
MTKKRREYDSKPEGYLIMEHSMLGVVSVFYALKQAFLALVGSTPLTPPGVRSGCLQASTGAAPLASLQQC